MKRKNENPQKRCVLLLALFLYNSGFMAEFFVARTFECCVAFDPNDGKKTNSCNLSTLARAPKHTYIQSRNYNIGISEKV